LQRTIRGRDETKEKQGRLHSEAKGHLLYLSTLQFADAGHKC